MNFSFDKQKIKIGMRTAKTGLAVFLVLLLFHFLSWEGSQIAALTAVFSLREDLDKSWSFGLSRVVGNTIGGLMALIYFLLMGLLGQHYLVTLLAIPLLTMFTIVFNVAINNTNGIVGSAAAFMIIALSVPTGNAFAYAIIRVLQTFLGVFVAILVNFDWISLYKKFFS